MDKENLNTSHTTPGHCGYCGGPVDFEDLHEVAESVFNQADALGLESLTEDEQMVIERRMCADCYQQ